MCQITLVIVDEYLIASSDRVLGPDSDAKGLKSVNYEMSVGAICTSMIDVTRQFIKMRPSACVVSEAVFAFEPLEEC